VSESREAWSEVGHQFEDLGRTLREHFAAPGSGEPAGGAAGAPGAPEGPPAGRAQVQEAIHRLRDAAQRLGEQAGEAARDQAVREAALRATRSLADAVEATFGQLSEQLRSRSGGAGGTGAGPGPGAPSGDAGPAQPQSLPGPQPDPAPGDDPAAGGGPTRPPAD
jgi:hypothetical protein